MEQHQPEPRQSLAAVQAAPEPPVQQMVAQAHFPAAAAAALKLPLPLNAMAVLAEEERL